MKLITLQYAATCRECKAELHPGQQGRWYGRGRVYGVNCHPDTRQGRTTTKGPGLVSILKRLPGQLPCETCGGLPCLEGCGTPAQPIEGRTKPDSTNLTVSYGSTPIATVPGPSAVSMIRSTLAGKG